MILSVQHHRSFGNTGLRVPPICFSTCAVANRRCVIPDQTKREICGEWFRHVAPPLLLEHTVGPGHRSAMEIFSRTLQRLEIPAEEVIFILKFPSECNETLYREVVEAAPAGCPLLAAVEMPSDCPAGAISPFERDQRLRQLVASYSVLEKLKSTQRLAAIGAAAAHWRELQTLESELPLDWIGLDAGFTVMRHPRELLSFMTSVVNVGVPVIVSRVFESGFLVGGTHYENRTLCDDNANDRQILAWRKAFVALCHGHGVTPAHACIQFALAGPGVAAVVVDTTHPDRVAENVSATMTKVPIALWESMKEEGLLAAGHPFLD